MTAAQRANNELLAEGARLQRELEEALQTAHAAAQDLDEARVRLSELEPRLAITEKARDALDATRVQLEGENASLRHDLLASAEGRELVELRERIKTAEQERARAERLREQAEEEMARLAASESRQRADVEALLRRCEAAERRAEALTEPQMQKDNEVLRGLVTRQKEQLQQQFLEISTFRRARLGVRFGYLLFGMGVVGVIWFGLKMFPNALQAIRSWGF
jgi:chromosome segregation ATPase